ncbi:MAG: Holliday junction branch migration protein RuvA [bacterium]
MIERLTGILREKGIMGGIIEVGGVGLSVMTPVGTLEMAGSVNSQVSLYTHFVVRQDALELYAFNSPEDRDLFRRIISIPGIGPKTALAILSTFNREALAKIISEGKVATLEKIPGVGKKTAERLFVELKAILNLSPTMTGRRKENSATFGNDSELLLIEDAVAALRSLGMSSAQARSLVEEAWRQHEGDLTVEGLVKIALKGG